MSSLLENLTSILKVREGYRSLSSESPLVSPWPLRPFITHVGSISLVEPVSLLPYHGHLGMTINELLLN